MTSNMASVNSEEPEAFPMLKITSAIEPSISSGVLREKWSSLARALGIPNDSIKRIRFDLHLDKVSLSDVIHEVIEEWHGRCGSGATVHKLIKAFEDLDLNSVGEQLRLDFNLPCKGFENSSLSWDEIGSEFQRKVESSLKTFYPSIQFGNESKSKLAGEVLVELMTGKEPSPIKDVIPEALKYYVPRTLVTRNVLTEQIFERSSDTFIFTGIERHALSSKAGSQRTDTTSSQLDGRDPEVRHMVMEMPSHFSKFQPSSNSAVHHVKFEEDKFYWVKSIGPLRNLRRSVDKAQVRLSEGDFLNRICSSSVPNLPVCISDSPGMGKSEILKQFARNIATVQPERTIIFQEFPKFVDIVIRHNRDDNDIQASIKITLQELTCKNELGVRILNSKLTAETTTVELFLDGYDELGAESVQMANNILKRIRSSLKSIRLWVTTRPHLLANLENMLTVLGYTIQSFTSENQINFLTSYWSREQNLPSVRLAQYATNCLNQLKSTLGAKEKHIAGIPLQCYMIGEVYEEEAKDYSQGDAHLIYLKIRITTITELYKLLIEKKLRKYQSTYSKTFSDQVLINMHIQLALRLLFPEYFEKAKSKFGEVGKNDVLNVGILESKTTEGELRFIHRTFAEYFVALHFVNAVSGEYIHGGIGAYHCTGHVLKSFLSEVFMCHQSQETYKFKNHVICFFINSLLPGRTVQANIPQPFHEICGGTVVMTELARACAAGNLINIFNLFDSFKLFDKVVYKKDLTLEAIKMSSVEIVKRTIDGLERFNNLDSYFPGEALREAVKRGEYSLVEFVFNEKRFQTMMKDVRNLENIEVLHCCVKDSKDNSVEIIRQKIEVIQFLVKKNHLILEEKSRSGNTPLLRYNVHIRLLVKLIELGANVFAINNKAETILHFKDFTPTEYHLLLTSIKRENLVELVNVRGGRRRLTPLLKVIYELNPEEKTLDVFKEAGADFNICESYVKDMSCSLLAHAILKRRNATTLRKLVQCGSDVRWRGKDGDNLLHFATENCNLDAVYMLLESDVDVNAVNNNLETPLHILARKYYDIDDFLKIMKAILFSGGNAAALNSSGNTFLHEALLNDDRIYMTAEDFRNVVKLLTQLDCPNIVEIENNDGRSSLVVSLQKLDVEEETLSLLHESGVNLLKSATVKIVDNASSTSHHVADYNLLHVACEYARYKVAPFLLRIGLNVNAKDWSMMTPLHYTISGYRNANNRLEDCWKTIKILIENGADVYPAQGGDTFLHVMLKQFHYLDESFHAISEFLVRNDCIKLFNTHGKGGVTPLHLLVKLGKVRDGDISFLHASGVNFDSVDSEGDSVLVYAIRAHKIRGFLGNLISCGANAEQTNNKGRNLLHIAAHCHNIHVIEFIVNLGVDVNAVDINGDTPLHLCLEYFSDQFDINPGIQVAISLVRNRASVVTLNKEGRSPFSLAKQRFRGVKALMQLVYDRLADERDKLDENGNTVIHQVVSGKDFVLAQELVEIGVNLNLQNKKLQTPLHMAALIADKEEAMKMIKLLISNTADPVKKDENDCTFLHILLAPNGNLSPASFHYLADLLIKLEHSKSLEAPGWNNGTTPIHLVLCNLNVECKTVELLSPHLDWNLADKMGKTPLCFATCRIGNASLLPQLVELGAVHGHLDHFGNNLLHNAAQYGNIDGLKYFISLGLDVNTKNLCGNTPLHIAVILGRENVPEMINILAEGGADSNLKNNMGQTPLFILAQKLYLA